MKKRLAYVTIAIFLTGIIGFYAWQIKNRRDFEMAGGYYTIFDEKGQVICETGLKVTSGDEYVNAQNQKYRVETVRGSRATARLLGTVDLSWDEAIPSQTIPAGGSPLQQALPLGANKLIVVYHTHSDESYTPTDGAPAIPGNGGIYQVGTAFVNSLRDIGFTVIHDMTAHDPHDALAYSRSRRTVSKYLSYQPYLYFDVHRDSAPASAYTTTVDNKPMARIMLVVGRQNPMMSANYSVARRLKYISDMYYPNLVRGIFIAHGNYNQDLDAGAVLMEVGTETQPRPEAEAAASIFAHIVGLAYGAPGR